MIKAVLSLILRDIVSRNKQCRCHLDALIKTVNDVGVSLLTEINK